MEDFYEQSGWTVVHHHAQPAREPERCNVDDLPSTVASHRYITTAFPNGVYRHQHESFNQFCLGNNVCLTTGTSSGKSALFYYGGIDVLSRDPQARVLAIYPMKALGVEQEDRWRSAMERSGLNVSVGRIDGSVRQEARSKILQDCRVVIVTPDRIDTRWLDIALVF